MTPPLPLPTDSPSPGSDHSASQHGGGAAEGRLGPLGVGPQRPDGVAPLLRIRPSRVSLRGALAALVCRLPGDEKLSG